MDTETKVFLGKRFKKYYWDNLVKAPRKVNSREFGFGTLEDKIKFRHKSFNTQEELTNFLKREAPFFISYSAAYYEYPENQPMKTKNWLGADLIFDLDVDIEYLNNESMQEMKRQVIAVVEFLESDFGFGKADLTVNFSGGKGYHVHVFSDDVAGLGQKERRMIVDYMTGTGAEVSAFMRNNEEGAGISYSHGTAKQVQAEATGPTEDSVGWARRIYSGLLDFFSSSPKDMMMVSGIGGKTAEKIYSNQEKYVRLLKSGHYESLPGITDKLMKKIISDRSIRIKDADKQVTLDTARLIRLPDSIHGGTGLLAKKAQDIDSFNPLVDAIAFSDEEINVKTVKAIPSFELNENTFKKAGKGEKLMMPEYAAVYLMVKGACDYLP